MNNSYYHRVPDSILANLNLACIDITLVLQGFAVRERWPWVSITIDGSCVHDGHVVGNQTFVYQNRAAPEQQHCEISIDYHGKQDEDNLLDDRGQLVDTQSLLLKEILINGVDIIKTGAIHRGLGYYRMQLDDDKKTFFETLGLPTGDTTRTHMFENGVWRLTIALPLLTTLSRLNSVIEPCENIDLNQLLQDLFQRTDVCTGLEQKKSA